MKSITLVVALALVLAFSVGCSQQWYEHDTVYKTNDHMLFSMFGYQDPSLSDLEKQQEQEGWWGEPVELDFVPAQ